MCFLVFGFEFLISVSKCLVRQETQVFLPSECKDAVFRETRSCTRGPIRHFQELDGTVANAINHLFIELRQMGGY